MNDFNKIPGRNELGDADPFDLSESAQTTSWDDLKKEPFSGAEVSATDPFDLSGSAMPELTLAGQEADETEKKERRLREEVLEMVEEKYGRLGRYYQTMAEDAMRSGLAYGKAVADGIDELYATRRRKDMERTEALVALIDARFGQSEEDDGVRARRQEESKDEYLGLTRNKAGLSGEILDGMGKRIRQTEGEAEWTLAGRIHQYGETQENEEKGIAEAYVSYIDNPTKAARKRLNSKVADGTYESGRSLYGVMEVLEGSRNAQVQEFVNVLNDTRKVVGMQDEAYHDAVMKYLKFKMEQAGVEEVDESDNGIGRTAGGTSGGLSTEWIV